MSHTATTARPGWGRRTLCLFLTAILLLGMVPALTLPAQAHWADPYLDQLVEWGFMRGDQTANPNEPLTRADFMAIVNRAYGYHETGPIPFEDVLTTDWFYDDVRIAYTANYISGTSETTVSPNATLNRETVIYILGKNMLLQETPGESLAFADSRDTSDWSRGMVKSAVDHYLVSGYDDNTFRPKSAISRGEMAVLLTQCVGTPIQESGRYELGDVFGNVTITAPGVTLRDTTISGDLYITGGVGLGDIRLENVKVLGRIIASGTGESEKGDASIVMRNVTADEMLVDNLKNQYVTIRAEGLTEIGTTLVRTPTYLEDNTTDDAGLRTITLEGEAGTRLDLAGRIKEVVDKTPSSLITVAKGTVQKLTVDEAAVGAQVQLDRGTEVKELNLDIGTNVSGQGDVALANINAPGSTLTMLPQKIFIRPGLTANVGGVNMDAAAAEESSRDPMILSGYPIANDVNPTGLNAVFATNKRGTVYWAISPITDGSVGADDLISPPSYGSVAERTGSITTPSADTQVQSQVTGLTSGGSYYLSAVLVDGREARSPVKVIAFTTPDNSVPAFAQGYPEMTLVTDTMAQVTVMPTKSCKMYYAVLPRSAQAPTPAELRSASVVGHLGYGVVDVVRNTESSLTVSRQLEELKDYTLYLWLTDANGANSSAVTPVQFTTVDKTPPEFVVAPYVNQIQATSVRLAGTVNEDATVFWAVVERGTDYPKPQPGVPNYDEDGVTVLPYAALDSDYAKLQVSSGMNCLRSGSVNARKDTEFTFTVTGLQEEKTYDLYYLARDTAGNYSVQVEKMEIHTQDNSGPIVHQYFSDYSGLDNTVNPLPSTDVILEFSEDVCCTADGWGGLSFSALASGNKPASVDTWPSQPGEVLITALRNSITLYQDVNNRPQKVTERTADGQEGWVIDYRKATVTNGDGGKVLVTFPGGEGLNLASGASYYFEFRDMQDTSPEGNKLVPNPLNYSVPGAETHNVPRFTTVFAQVHMSSPGVGSSDTPSKRNTSGQYVDAKGNAVTDPADRVDERVDLSFRLDPEATAKVEDNNAFDILLYGDSVMQYSLYYRLVDEAGKGITNPEDEAYNNYRLPSKYGGPDENGWYYLGHSGAVNPDPQNGNEWAGKSVNRNFNQCDQTNFPPLNQLSEDLSYDFVISLTHFGTSDQYTAWNGRVNFQVYVLSSGSRALSSLAADPRKANLEDFTKDGVVTSDTGVNVGITAQAQNFLQLRQPFVDSQLPKFNGIYPTFTDVGDTFATMNLNLTRDGTIYYVVAEEAILEPTLAGPATPLGNEDQYTEVTDVTFSEVWKAIPRSGHSNGEPRVKVTSPVSGDIFNPTPYRGNAICGSVAYAGGNLTLQELLSRDTQKELKPNTNYYVYFVLKGVSDELSDVYTYKFRTNNISRPKINLERGVGGIVNVTTLNVPGDLDYVVYTSGNLASIPTLTQNLTGSLLAHALPDAYLKYQDGTVGADGKPVEKDMTVLQAMITTYNHNTASADKGSGWLPTEGSQWDGYSVFDVYASDTIKATVQTLIQRRNTGLSATGDMEIKTEAATPRPLNENTLEDLDPLIPYTFLVTGRHPSSTDVNASYTFKAIDNVIIPDQQPPELSETDTTASIMRDSTTDGTFKGRISLVFDKDLYWVESQTSTKALEVHQGCSHNDGNCVDIKTKIRTLGTITDNGTVTTPTTTINFNYSGLSVGDNIVIPYTGLFSNASRVPTENRVTATVRQGTTTDNDSGMAITGVYLEITWGGRVIFTSQTIPMNATTGSGSGGTGSNS